MVLLGSKGAATQLKPKAKWEKWSLRSNLTRVLSDVIIQATISAVWLAENIPVNPKLVNSAISPVQKNEIECKTLKFWVQNGEIKNDWQLRQNWATTDKMADKNETKIETPYLNFDTKTS